MRKIKVKYNLLVFLYAYLRQIDLSLDRSRWGPWNNLKDYYGDKINPLEVSGLLSKASNISPPDKELELLIKTHPALVRILRYLMQFATNKCYLSEHEILYCYQLLNRFDKQLQTDVYAYGETEERLRQDIASFDYDILEYKLWPRERNRAMKIEHFFQNEITSVVKMGAFVNGLDLEERSFLNIEST